MGQKPHTSAAGKAARAERTVRHYSRVPGYRGEADYGADITDFLADLRHLCRRAGLDFDQMVAMSRRHFEEEGKGRPGRRKTKNPGNEAGCPNCQTRLECDPDQDGACDWICPNCGWHQHVPAHKGRRKGGKG
jgi:hypothetical protein